MERMMNRLFSFTLRAGLLAAGLAALMTAPVSAAPLARPTATAPSADVTLVKDSETLPPPSRNAWWWRNRGRHVDRGQWGHDDGRHDSWRYRNHYRGPSRSGFYFGLGVAPSLNYHVAPRRVYRSSSSAHVQWCYDRYRSYRAWDNTFQPYNGPRRQCYSPYD
jgi:hypothetical protein